jgi:hypothetical protein
MILSASRLKRKLSFLRRQEPRKIFRVAPQAAKIAEKSADLPLYRLLHTNALVFSGARLRIPAPDQVEGDVPSQE